MNMTNLEDVHVLELRQQAREMMFDMLENKGMSKGDIIRLTSNMDDMSRTLADSPLNTSDMEGLFFFILGDVSLIKAHPDNPNLLATKVDLKNNPFEVASDE